VAGTIAWWGWLLIWLGLGLGLIGMLAFFAWRLFRAGLGLVDDVADLTDKLDILGTADDSHDLPPTTLAVLANVREVKAREAERVAIRRERRESKRKLRMARAREIGSVDVAGTEWPAALSTPRRRRRSKSRRSASRRSGS
jgi:hypothetical protein